MAGAQFTTGSAELIAAVRSMQDVNQQLQSNLSALQSEVEGVAKLDHAVNSALILAHVALSRGDRVGLCTFSHRVHALVAPRAHLAQIRLITVPGGHHRSVQHDPELRAVSLRFLERMLGARRRAADRAAGPSRDS